MKNKSVKASVAEALAANSSDQIPLLLSIIESLEQEIELGLVKDTPAVPQDTMDYIVGEFRSYMQTVPKSILMSFYNRTTMLSIKPELRPVLAQELLSYTEFDNKLWQFVADGGILEN